MKDRRMTAMAGAIVAAALLAGCADKPQVVASGNNITISHKLVDFGGARQIATDYCNGRDMNARLIGKKTETRVVSFYECVAKE